MRYELLEPIGTGGMATVHRARLRGVAGFERIVALKRIRPELATTPEYVERFIHEARIGAVFAHPNVIQVIELGRDDESHFIAMEHLEGWSLLRIAAAAYYANIEIPLPVIVSLLRDLCEALDHIHGHRVIHRDISLGNLFVTRSGHLKLIDFGIATRFGEGDDVNEVAGKPSYMSPEAIRGRGCDARTDLFSMGVVAWELLTRQKLFDGVTDRDIMRAVLFRRAMPASHHRADCPLLLDTIIHDLLAKDARRRTPSAAVLRDQLAALTIDGQPVDVARWVGSLFGGPTLEVEPEAPTQPSPMVVAVPPSLVAAAPSSVVVLPATRHHQLPYLRGLAAVAIAMMTTAIAWPADAPASVVEGERITMHATTPPADIPRADSERVDIPRVDVPRVDVPRVDMPRADSPRADSPRVDMPRADSARVDIPRVDTPRVDMPRADSPRADSPRVDMPRADAARVDIRRGRRVDTQRAKPVATDESRAKLVIMVAPTVTPTAPKPAAIVASAQPAVELPPVPRPPTIAPDRVKLLAGSISRVNLARLGPEIRRSFTAVLCIDASGAVTSSKLPSNLPAWLRDDLTRDLAKFRFTPHADGPACFARFMKID